VDERHLAMVITKIIIPRGSNHSTLNKGDLIPMYCIQNNVQLDLIFVIRDYMMKAKRLMDFRLPYVVFVSKFIKYFRNDVEDKLEESTKILNQAFYLNLHKMGFTKVRNV